jgi:TusA-related sulfurtransferase
LSVGETLTVLSTDPAAVIDFTYYCHCAGLELLSVAKEPGLFTFEIRKPAQLS